jgi:hypothetical protein
MGNCHARRKVNHVHPEETVLRETIQEDRVRKFLVVGEEGTGKT